MNVAKAEPEKFKSIAGWLTVTDQHILGWILDWQNACEPAGDLVELGVFQGKSAILIGGYKRPDETFTVCDLFDTAGSEEAISPAVREYYADLTQKKFEDNYRAFHADLPVIVRGLSSSIIRHVKPGACRLMHIDASHQYEHVLEDAASAKVLLRKSGVVVFDDFRTEHTPGTAAAVWETVINHDLRPICVSHQKLYATWGDATLLQDHLIKSAAGTDSYRTTYVGMPHGRKLVRLFWKKPE